MPVTCYVLVQTEVGHAGGVAGAIGALPGVLHAEYVTGPYDVVVRAEADSMDQLARMVVSQIQLIPGITRTLTCPVVDLT